MNYLVQCHTFVTTFWYILNMKTILIADDQIDIVNLISSYCINEGYAVVTAYDGQQALDLYYQHKPDLVCLDVAMPMLDGFSVCKEIRKTSMVPIIMVTAKGEDFERIIGLDIGADDYVVKPFSLKELMARFNALFRRLDGFTAIKKSIAIHDLLIDLESMSVSIDRHPIALTKKEFDLLVTLASHPHRVFTRDDLLTLCWGDDYFGDDRTVDAHIKRLRAKVDSVGHPHWNIKTMWGVGYKFEHQ